MKYLIVLLLCGCSGINTQNMTYEQKMQLYDRMKLQPYQVQYYPIQKPVTCYTVNDVVQCY